MLVDLGISVDQHVLYTEADLPAPFGKKSWFII